MDNVIFNLYEKEKYIAISKAKEASELNSSDSSVYKKYMELPFDIKSSNGDNLLCFADLHSIEITRLFIDKIDINELNNKNKTILDGLICNLKPNSKEHLDLFFLFLKSGAKLKVGDTHIIKHLKKHPVLYEKVMDRMIVEYEEILDCL